ncbi:hypothetical protein KIL84_007101 [Mauremys mutica]|uniref:Sushi domain-containing protein n=1 Tax=Mauremys mutica TaxID=74926 RepID=A0A9D3X2L0_9SAUR|nr:hypothetical protein KIL84_007101 [Mauremys mutica]
MVSAPRCPPGARGLLALLLLLPLPGARGRSCKPLELANGRVHLPALQVGTTATFSCNEGYRLIGTTSAKCVDSGNGVDWDKELPHCQAIPCRPPPDITHGSHNGQTEQGFTFGSAVTYKCDQGFSLIGEASIHCTSKDNVNGEWSGPAPECKVVRCPEPEVKNGKKQSGFGPDYSYGNTVIFECDSGYTLTGSSSVKCDASNSWVPSLPTCQRRNTGTIIAIGKMPIILAVLITNLFIRQ